jgi:hypothetical protein
MTMLSIQALSFNRYEFDRSLISKTPASVQIPSFSHMVSVENFHHAREKSSRAKRYLFVTGVLNLVNLASFFSVLFHSDFM